MVWSFFKKQNNGDGVDKRGERRGDEAVEDEGQTSEQPATSTASTCGTNTLAICILTW